MPVPYSMRLRAGGPISAITPVPGNGANALSTAERDIVGGAFDRRVVEHGDAADLEVAHLGAHQEVLQPLRPGQHETSRCAARWSRSGGSAAPSSGPRTRWRASRPARGCGRSRSGTGPAPICQRVPLRIVLSMCREIGRQCRAARRWRDPRPCASRRARAGSAPRSASASRSPSVSTPVSRKPRSFWNAFTAATERSLNSPSAGRYSDWSS